MAEPGTDPAKDPKPQTKESCSVIMLVLKWTIFPIDSKYSTLSSEVLLPAFLFDCVVRLSNSFCLCILLYRFRANHPRTATKEKDDDKSLKPYPVLDNQNLQYTKEDKCDLPDCKCMTAVNSPVLASETDSAWIFASMSKILRAF